MNNLMIFQNKPVEVFKWNGKILFNPYHCGECLELSPEGVRTAITKMNEKQAVKLKNSDVANYNIRKLNNAGENFLTESGVYKLIFKSQKKEAEKFQDWVTDEVLPSIRKTGSYNTKNEKSEKEKTLNLVSKAIDELPNDENKNKTMLELLKLMNSKNTPASQNNIKSLVLDHSVKEFVNDNLEAIKAENNSQYIKASYLFLRYKEWCFQENIVPVGKKSFNQTLYDLFKNQYKVIQRNNYYSIKFND